MMQDDTTLSALVTKAAEDDSRLESDRDLLVAIRQIAELTAISYSLPPDRLMRPPILAPRQAYQSVEYWTNEAGQVAAHLAVRLTGAHPASVASVLGRARSTVINANRNVAAWRLIDLAISNRCREIEAAFQ
jgi:hypothetical protein